MNRDRRLWAFPAACFLAAVVVVGLRLAWREPAPQQAFAEPSPDRIELAELMQKAGYHFRPCFPNAEPKYWTMFWITADERQDDLSGLCALPVDQEEWLGVVLAEQTNPGLQPRGVVVNGWSLHGDPLLTNRLAGLLKALR